MPELVLIAAVATGNRVIGDGMELPWHLPADLRHFKNLTRGEALLMGRRTYESILHQFGGPLPERRMVVVTSRGALPAFPDAEVYPSPEDALTALADLPRVFIGGGGAIYRQFLPHADRLELTEIEGAFEGDTYFPDYTPLVGPVFEEVWSEAHPASDGRPAFRFVRYVRRADASPQQAG